VNVRYKNLLWPSHPGRFQSESTGATPRQNARRGILPTTRAATELVTVSSWIEQFIAESRAPATAVARQYALAKIAPTLGHRPLHVVTAIEVHEWLRRLECGDRAKQQAYDLLKRVYALAVKLGRADTNPVASVPRPGYQRKPINSFSGEDVRRILTAARDLRLFGLIALAFLTGMRQGEILGLRWADVDWESSRLTIAQGIARQANGTPIQRPPKTAAAVREVHLSEDLIRVLLGRAVRAVREGLTDCPLVFANLRGNPISTSQFAYRVWKPLLLHLGLAARGLHHGRHAFCTLLRREGAAGHLVSNLMGHSSESTTRKIYSHVLPGDTSTLMATLQESIGYKMATEPFDRIASCEVIP
jgi:integrase